MYAERQARRRINQKKTREPAGVSARGLFCARIYAARRAQVAGCPRPHPPAPAPACAHLPGPCVRRKSAPRRPHACAAARARHLSHCVHFTSLSARTPSSGPRAGGVSCRRAFGPHGYAPQLPCFRSALSAMPAAKYAARRLRCSKHATPARACPRPRLSTQPVRSAQIRAAPAARLPACRPCVSARRFLRRLFAAPRKAARRALRFLPNAAGPLQPAGFKYTKKHVAVRGQIALKY